MSFFSRSLFRKIFVWFLLAIGLALLSSSIVLSIARRAFEGTRGRVEKPESVLRERARAATAIAEKGSAADLADYARRVNSGGQDRTYVMDENGSDLGGEQVPVSIAALARRAAQSGRVESSYTEYGTAAAKIQGTKGPSWLIAVSQEQPPADGDEWLLVRLFLEITAVAVGALLLARYIASPILILREATAQIESGNLSARVMEKLGQRRDELGDLGRNFDRMAERIEALVSAQRDLVTDVSHELRSPLARVSVALGLARRNAGAEAVGHLDRIEAEAERLNKLIGQLLTLSRLESASEFNRAPLDLSALVEEVAADGAFEARARGCFVTVKTCADCIVCGSVEPLRSAIENVVRNAVRHTMEGSAVDIILENNTSSPTAVITVRDHGPGVPEASLARIFQPFYREGSGNGSADSGSGLGLAIAFRAVRLHGGSIQAFNASGGGLMVEIRLPLEKAARVSTGTSP